MRYREFLSEGQKYHDMFNGMLALVPNFENDVNETVAWAKSTLKRKDRIDWYLRWYRLALLDSNNEAMLDAGMSAIINLKMRYAKALRVSPTTNIDSELPPLRRDLVAGELTHLLSLNLPQIEQVQFDFQVPSVLVSQLKDIEQQWKETRKQIIRYDDYEVPEVFLELNDGWAWYDLETSSCDKEGDAMGHCGNAAGEYDDTVLSLRHSTNNGEMIDQRPSLTFIQHADGTLGEMKGRGNQKPNVKYHPQIIALLSDPRIKGITGGGYMPHNNFDMSDLSDDIRQELVAKNPNLKGPWELYEEYWDIKRADAADPRLPELEKRFYPKLKSWVANISHNDHKLEAVDLGADKIVYERFKDYDSYSGHWNGVTKVALSAFEDRVEYDYTVRGSVVKEASPMAQAISKYHGLDISRAEGIVKNMLVKIEPLVLEYFLPYDVEFDDDTEIVRHTDGSIAIQGDLSSFLESWFVNGKTYDSDFGITPYSNRDVTFADMDLAFDNPIASTLASYVDSMSRAHDYNYSKRKNLPSRVMVDELLNMMKLSNDEMKTHSVGDPDQMELPLKSKFD